MRISGLLSGFFIFVANAGMAAAQDVPRFDVEAGCRGATKSRISGWARTRPWRSMNGWAVA